MGQLAVGTVDGVLEGQLAGLLHHVVAGDQHARLRVPQLLRLAHQGHDGQGVVGVDEVAAGDHVAGLQPRVGEGPCPEHRGEVQLDPLPLVQRGLPGGGGSVGGVVDGGVLRHVEARVHRGIVQPRLHHEGRRIRVPGEAVAVGGHGRWRVIIKKARQSCGAAIGDVGGNLRHNDLVQDLARGIRQAHGVPSRLGQLEGGVQLRAG